MRVLLVSSSFEDESRESDIQCNSHYPLGLGYLHSFLESKGHEVKTLFLNDFSPKDCFRSVYNNVLDFQPEVVGFNVLTNNRASTSHLIEHLHQQHPTIRIVVGGIHTSVMYEQLLSKFPYIIAVIGEGEMTLAELLEKFEKNESFDHVSGLSFFKNSELITTLPRALIADLDLLPFPKHAVFFNSQRTKACLLTSRGCPFNCSFCVLDAVSKGRVRFRTVSNVINEIGYIIKLNPKIDEIWIHDDVFLIDNNRAIEFCNEVIKRGIHVKFICSARFKPVSKELVQKLEEAGFVQVLFGLESGAPSVLKAARKQITQDDILKAIKLFSQSKISVAVFLIVGLYGENNETIKETIRLVKKMQRIKYMYFSDIGVCVIYPGTEIFSIAKDAGMIDDSYWLTNKPTPFFTVEHNVDRLFKYKKQILIHISFDKFFTPKGFIFQIGMLPSIVRFIISSPTFAKIDLLSPLFKKIKKNFPWLYDQMRRIYHKKK